MSSEAFADNVSLTEAEIQAAAAKELRQNLHYVDDELRENWRLAYGYYRGEYPKRAAAYTSDAVSTDVSDVIEWMLPAIIKPLVESPDVVRFDAVNPEDDEQADLESDYVHHTLMKKCGGFTKLYVHIKDALLLKAGVFCTYWDEGIRNQLEEYQNLQEVEVADLLSPADGSEVRLIASDSREEPLPDPLSGLPVPGQTRTLYDVTVRRFTPNGRPVVENCVPEAFKVRFGHDSIDLTDARYCAYTMLKSRAELASEYDEDKVADLSTSENQTSYWDNEVRHAREDVERAHNSLHGERNETGDPSQDIIQVHRVYMMLDADGDGREERYLIVLAGATGEVMLDHYEVPENPFSASTPFIAGHKFWGYSLFDKLQQITDHKTRLLRMLEDNLDLQNNPRKKVVRGQATLDDLLVNQVGGLWRMDQIDAVQEVPAPAIQQTATGLLDYWDKIRSERSGMDPNAASITDLPEESMNAAVERVISMKEELVGLIIRVFAETGVKDMMCKLRNLLMRHMPREELVQLRNKWATVNPGNWVERTNTTILVGLGTGDKIRKTQGLTMVYGMQKEAAQSGMLGVMVSPERMNHTISELIRVQGVGDPDDFVLDPALLDPQNQNHMSPRGQEAVRAWQLQQQQMQQEQQQEMAQQQAAAQQQEALLNLQRELEQMRQQGKMMTEQLKAQQDERDRIAETFRFMQEERREWAELAGEQDADKAKANAQVATALIQQGGQIEAAARQAEAQARTKGEDE